MFAVKVQFCFGENNGQAVHFQCLFSEYKKKVVWAKNKWKIGTTNLTVESSGRHSYLRAQFPGIASLLMRNNYQTLLIN